MKLILALTAAALLAASCDRDDTLAGFGGADQTWTLQSLDGARFDARATLTFPEAGRIAGDAPCNSYFGPQTAAYPGFAAGPLATTRRACPELGQESDFIAALEAMRRAEVRDDLLILSDGAGRDMIFAPDPG